MLLLSLLSVSWAGVPVISDGGDQAAIMSQVAQRTGLPLAQLEPVSLDALLAAPPRAIGQAVVRHCAGAPTEMSEVRTDLVRAEAAWARSEAAVAMDHLDLGVAAAGCLRELGDPAVLARLFLLRGALTASDEASAAELHSALAFDRDIAWVDGFPDAGAPALAEAKLDPAGLTLTAVPGGGASGPWLDGRLFSDAGAQRALGAGLHLVQVAGAGGIQSAWLVADADATLVLPGSYRRPVLERLADPAARPEVALLLRATLADFRAAYVVSDGGLWLVTWDGESAHTTELVAPEAAETAPAEARRRRHK